MALCPTHSAVTHPHPPCAGAGVCYRCGRARWRKHLFRRPRWALLLGRGRPDPRGMPRGWATWLPPHAPAHVLSHLWPAARAKAPSRARRSAAQLAWEAAAAQRCRAPTGELVGRWPLAGGEWRRLPGEYKSNSPGGRNLGRGQTGARRRCRRDSRNDAATLSRAPRGARAARRCGRGWRYVQLGPVWRLQDRAVLCILQGHVQGHSLRAMPVPGMRVLQATSVEATSASAS